MLTKGNFTRDEWNLFFKLVQHHESFDGFSQPLLFCQTERRAVWCRKDPKKVFRMFHHRWRQSQDQEGWTLCRMETVYSKAEFSKYEWFWIPGAQQNRTEMMLASFGEPSQKSADNLSLHSQERPQGITSRIGSELSDDNVSSYGNGKPLQGQESLECSGQEYECCHGFGKPVRRTQTQEKKTRPKIRNMKVTNTEYMKKVFYNLQNKLAEVQNLPEFAMEACKTNMLMWSRCLVSSMKAAIHLNVQELRIQWYSKFVQCHWNVDNG